MEEDPIRSGIQWCGRQTRPYHYERRTRSGHRDPPPREPKGRSSFRPRGELFSYYPDGTWPVSARSVSLRRSPFCRGRGRPPARVGGRGVAAVGERRRSSRVPISWRQRCRSTASRRTTPRCLATQRRVAAPRRLRVDPVTAGVLDTASQFIHSEQTTSAEDTETRRRGGPHRVRYRNHDYRRRQPAHRRRQPAHDDRKRNDGASLAVTVAGERSPDRL